MKNTNVPTVKELRDSVIAKEGKIEGLKVKYLNRPRQITYPTGLKGYRATVELSAPGFRTQTRNLLGDSQGWRF